jgi:hypothetical protein
MEESTGDILAISFVDKRETALKSPNMEPVGLKRALHEIQESGNNISEVVTDAHSQVPPILSRYLHQGNTQQFIFG